MLSLICLFRNLFLGCKLFHIQRSSLSSLYKQQKSKDNINMKIKEVSFPKKDAILDGCSTLVLFISEIGMGLDGMQWITGWGKVQSAWKRSLPTDTITTTTVNCIKNCISGLFWLLVCLILRHASVSSTYEAVSDQGPV